MSLTRELDNRQSPIRVFIEERLSTSAALQREFREGAGALVVNGTGASPGTVGTAADWLLRFLVCPYPETELACRGAAMASNAIVSAFDELARTLGYEDPLGPITVGRGSIGPSSFTGPIAGADIDFDHLARSCWAFALLTEGFRGGPSVLTRGPLGTLRNWGIVSAGDLLDLAPAEGIDELAQFRSVLVEGLLPRLESKSGRWTVGPTFASSGAVGGADADLVAAGQLIELKTSLGRKRQDGSRTCELAKKDLHEIVAYALLDFDDRYELAEVALFSARYNHYVLWPLDELIGRMSGGALDVTEARAGFEAAVREVEVERQEQVVEKRSLAGSRRGPFLNGEGSRP